MDLEVLVRGSILKKYLNKAVEVIWRDAVRPTDEWKKQKKLTIPDNIITTYGVLVKFDKKNLMIAQTFCEDGMLLGVFTITKGQVIKIKLLRSKK